MSRVRVAAVVSMSIILTLTGGLRAAWSKPVDPSYRPSIWVTYRADGDFPRGQVDYLVATPDGKAVFEQNPDGSGILLDIHWEDVPGEHYAAWTPYGPAIEVFVPADPAQPTYRFVYPWGRYFMKTEEEVRRPVPKILTEARARLFPAGRSFRVPLPPNVPPRQGQGS